MASPRPWPAVAPGLPPECLLNRCGSSSGATPLPSSETETATCASSRTAATRIGVDSGACRAALANRLLSTCTTRRRSAITDGRPAGRSTRTACRPPPPRNVLRARSTRAATSEGSAATESVPASMRPASSRSRMRPRMWPACSAMMRKNSRISAGSSSASSSSPASAEPLMASSGARSSWPTRPRNSVRIRSISSSGARSCMVTTTEPISPPSARMGVALMSVLTLRPSGTESTTSSARTVSPVRSVCSRGISASDTSRPSARRTETTSRRCSGGRPGVRRLSTMRRASRLNETGRPARASMTTTPTGDVSTRASRSARARRSLRCVRALVIAAAAWDANSVSTSSSSSVNSSPSAFSARKKWPTSAPWWRIGVPWKVRENIRAGAMPSART